MTLWTGSVYTICLPRKKGRIRDLLKGTCRLF